ncbi:hypothetical protein GCM10008171_09660 [Methylopila jiangsuensis]|uniref:AsmA domain-containing protein n=1 Tax=Methylopila jiangsuensis TaxID=586230 RepID=A0A9W6JEV5_9HYPH|nr:AsmA-like C-terminal region-containing protein [Methylopila jiangsuensis]MDR6285955.1 AsmA protein [Methylopila jiangsuensis]GLK75712.1 hypothetical protein GCM10008171_09660 [Methylopila jiangsuensis]
MRRIVLGLAGAAVALGVAGAALAVRASSAGLDATLLTALRAGSGLALEAKDARLTLWPTPRLRFDDVRVATAEGAPVARLKALVVKPAFMSLVTGRASVTDVTLLSPVIQAEAVDLERLARALSDAQRGTPPSVRVVDGEVRWGKGQVSAIDAGFALTRGGQLAATGVARFRDRTVEGAMTVDDVFAAARGARSDLRLKLDGDGLRIAFEGHAVRTEGGRRLEGELGLRARSLKEVAAWLGAPLPAVSAPLADVTLSGRGLIDRAGLALDGAELALDGAQFDGAARFGRTPDGRPDVEATLDAEAIDLTPYLGAVSDSPSGDWRRRGIDVRTLAALNLDLRLSARRLRAAAITLGPTAATVSVAHGALDMVVGEASVYGGVVGGRLALEPYGAAARLRLSLRGAGVELGPLLRDAAGQERLSGELSGEFAAEGQGATPGAILRSLSGRGSASLQGGAVGGLRARALALLGLGGKIEVRTAEGSATVSGGVARTGDLRLGGPSAELRLSGEADLPSGRLNLTGALAVTEGATIPARVRGRIDDPKLRLDPLGADRRSDAGGLRPAPAP